MLSFNRLRARHSIMEKLRSFRGREILITPRRLHEALPAIILGLLFNILDAVSTGLLVFPSSGNTFKSLQIQAVSMYIMSTILSQVAMTLGGSLIPGALGAMLIEILPFLRGIGSDLQIALGDDSPALVPTVMVAYTLTSFLIGIVFIALGAFKAGIIVAYFPRPVLTGVIGGIGVSLFILGLGLPQSPSAPSLTLSNAGSVLFGSHHLGLLFASCGPAFLLSFSLRSELIRRLTGGKSQHAYFIPFYFLLIPILFWIAVAASHKANAPGMKELVEAGWLFGITKSPDQGSGIGHAWVYWTLFDFSKVEMHALKHAITNIVLLVVIGVLNLPIYVPALGSSLKIPINMNHELVGQGVANLLAGVAGTVPNILQLSYSIFFTRAGGGRLEAAVVTALTFVFFLVSSLVVPYVPTVLASTLVLFLGIELTSDAVWESAKSLQFTEWLVVMTTIVACTFLGFAIGFGVGIGAAVVCYVLWGFIDTRAHIVDWDRETGLLGHSSELEEQQRLDCTIHQKSPISSIIPFLNGKDSQNFNKIERPAKGGVAKTSRRVRLLQLAGYTFFGSIPSVEAKLKFMETETGEYQFLIIDLTDVCRLETSAVELLAREARAEVEKRSLIFSGVSLDSEVYADLRRGGLELNFGGHSIHTFSIDIMRIDPLGFELRDDAIKWCESQVALDNAEHRRGSDNLHEAECKSTTTHRAAFSRLDTPAAQKIESEGDAARTFSELFGHSQLHHELFSPFSGQRASDIITQLKAQGGSIRSYQPGELIKAQGQEQPILQAFTSCADCYSSVDSSSRAIFIIQGRVRFEDLVQVKSGGIARLSVLRALKLGIRAVKSSMKPDYDTTAKLQSPAKLVSRILGAGESFALLGDVVERELEGVSWTHHDQVAVMPGGICWTIEVGRSEDVARSWPLTEDGPVDVILATGITTRGAG